MKTDHNIAVITPIKADFFKNLRDKSWTYIRTVVDIVREPVLILDKNLRVMAASESFYQMFLAAPKNTEGKIVYELGNGQWNIPALRELLEDILAKNIFFKGFEVAHEFPVIGHKVVILSGRQIYFRENTETELFPPIILLAMEDVTEMMAVAEKLADHTNQFEFKLTAKTQKLASKIEKLEKEINKLKNK